MSVCQHCGEPLDGKRRHAGYCDSTCRQELEGGKKALRSAASVRDERKKRPTDRDRVLTALRAAGPQGVHSHSIRKRGLSGHPSERCKELEERGYTIRREREYVDGRNGTRFYLLNEPTLTAGVCADGKAHRQGENLSRCGEHPVVSADPGEQSRPTGVPTSKESGSDTNPAVPSASDESGSGSGVPVEAPEPARLFEPAPPSQYDPWERAA